MRAAASGKFVDNTGQPDVRMVRATIQWMSVAHWVSDESRDELGAAVDTMHDEKYRAAGNFALLSKALRLCTVGNHGMLGSHYNMWAAYVIAFDILAPFR